MKSRWAGFLIEVVETIVLTLVIFFVVQTFVAQPYEILQQSMMPTLNQNEYVLVDKLSPMWSDYKRGDIVVFQPPPGVEEGGQDIPFVKRVIGVPGDTVEIIDGAVWVNGVKLDEPYVFPGQPTTPWSDQTKWVVPKGDLFVMGDHRAASKDSRAFGPIPRSSVIGRAWLRYWGGPFGLVGSATYEGIPDRSPAP
jgi:signal peptidase I